MLFRMRYVAWMVVPFFVMACGSDAPVVTPAVDAGPPVSDARPACDGVLDIAVPQPWLLAPGATLVFWTSVGQGVSAADGKVGLFDGCGKLFTLADGEAAPYGLAASGNVACWSDLGQTVNGSYAGDGGVKCWIGYLAGKGVVGQVYTVDIAVSARPGTVAISGDSVFWWRAGTIVRAPVTGSAPLAAVSTPLSAGFDGAPIAADDAEVFWSDTSGIYAAPVAGGAPRLVTTSRARTLLLDGADIYFVSGKDMLRVPKAGGAPQTVLTGIHFGNSIAADATNLYFNDFDQGASFSVPKTGGQPTPLGSDAAGYALATDAKFVYLGGGGVRRLPK